MTQKTLIKKYLDSLYPDWIREFEVHRINTEFGFIGPRGERNCREMLADKVIEGKLEGKYRWVRAKPMQKPENPMHMHNFRPEIIKQRENRQNRLL